jgi:hypothetical protein
LRTTPARKPRAECGCQPVAFIIASIVAPVGDCSNAMTRDCFEPRLALLGSGSPAPCRDDFVIGTAAGADAVGRFRGGQARVVDIGPPAMLNDLVEIALQCIGYLADLGA